jgi:hypothetical protein
MPVNKIKRNGSFAPLSAHYYKDDRIAAAGLASELLYVRGLALAADLLSDGFISDLQLSRYAGVGMKDAKRRAAKLVEVGLWERESGGYRITAWLRWNRSRDEILGLAEKDAGRKTAKAEEQPPEPPDDHQPSRPVPNGFRSESDPDMLRSPNGIQPRARSLSNSTPSNSKKRGAAAAADTPTPAINAGLIVGAWTEAFEANGTKPSAGMRGQVGRLAAELITAGNDPAKVLAAAQAAGAKGFATIDRELGAMTGRGRLKAVGDEEWRRFSEQ